MKRMKWFLPVLLLVVVACTPDDSPARQAPTFPDTAQTVLVEQLGAPNLVIEATELASSPDALRDTTEMWCVLSSVTPDGGEAIYSYALVFRSSGEWTVTLADAEDFATVGCADPLREE